LTVSEAYLQEFINKLQNWSVITTKTTYNEICDDLRTQAKNRLFGASSPYKLSINNPIADVYVCDSEATGGADVWRSVEQNYFIHPVTQRDYPPAGPIPIAVAPHYDSNHNVQAWLSADVHATNL
jgi:hypothetical protein